MAEYSSITKHPNLDQWVAIGADGRIAIRSGKVDIGQRISTALALIAAEELDVDYGSIDILQRETGLSPDEGITSGSKSMEASGNAVRVAAATARQHLLSQAADALGVAVDTLEVDDGMVASRGTNRSVSYSDLMGDKSFGIPVDPNVTVKSPDSYTIVGTQVEAKGMADIVMGKAHFVHDMVMPGMLHARVVRPPHYLAKLTGLDHAITERLGDDGVTVVRDGSFLAVVGADEYATMRAIERLNNAADWDKGDGLATGDIFEKLRGVRFPANQNA